VVPPRRSNTIEAILVGADLAFAERGFHGASIGYICERAGNTTGAFYSNWSTKLDLFADVYKRHTDQISADIAARLQRSAAGSLVEVFTEVFADNYDERWLALNIEFRLLCLRDNGAAAALAGYETDLVQRLGDQVENFLTAVPGPSLSGRQLIALIGAMVRGLRLDHGVHTRRRRY
jgi:AcrR family transcriptional regulator